MEYNGHLQQIYPNSQNSTKADSSGPKCFENRDKMCAFIFVLVIKKKNATNLGLPKHNKSRNKLMEKHLINK